MKILIVCTGNSCRSPMAEGLMRQLDSSIVVFSAGIKPENSVNNYAVTAMKELNIDISKHVPQDVMNFSSEKFDMLITLSDRALEHTSNIDGITTKRMHIRFDDPALTTGTDEEIMAVYRRVRDEIKSELELFWKVWNKGGEIEDLLMNG